MSTAIFTQKCYFWKRWEQNTQCWPTKKDEWKKSGIPQAGRTIHSSPGNIS